MPRRHPPREQRLDPLGYDLKARRDWAWTRLEKLAEHAESENVRYACLKEYIARLDPIPNGVPDDASRPVAVAIFLSNARAALPAHGVRLHLSSGDSE